MILAATLWAVGWMFTIGLTHQLWRPMSVGGKLAVLILKLAIWPALLGVMVNGLSGIGEQLEANSKRR